ncbi:ATP-binding cassette domain-containing protein [Pelomonas sp. UHG3]|uniref:ATP-binding cassette domain-containing protein n=1 Tax=Roseateles hydrophilus TaxID=2975054 RepID=A0ACC6C7T6_9BURK|nr:ATP-binding cassette domain-containing protein [Pelomonas sp. UHG3]MCY4744476.1 ATP-binding cassette domain-containing protein [Pelomonas sp. UHG3]
MIDIRLQLSVQDARRRFDLDIALATDAPVVALYGPSGAGKSLTLQAIAGLLPVRAGHVRLNGHTLLDTATGTCLPPEARGVGYLFQHYALFPRLSVRDNIAFGLTSWRRRLTADDAARVDALIASFGLEALAHSRPATLSGGQQQRVALARALACQPQVLLLDEPFAALHTTLRRQLRAELRELRQRLAIPTLLVSHDPEDVLALADEVLLLDGGGVQARLRADDPGLRAALEAAP